MTNYKKVRKAFKGFSMGDRVQVRGAEMVGHVCSLFLGMSDEPRIRVEWDLGANLESVDTVVSPADLIRVADEPATVADECDPTIFGRLVDLLTGTHPVEADLDHPFVVVENPSLSADDLAAFDTAIAAAFLERLGAIEGLQDQPIGRIRKIRDDFVSDMIAALDDAGLIPAEPEGAA
ncbi:MAG: hypothetical protein AAGK03_03425 [Pseudomonadota bacterium]